MKTFTLCLAMLAVAGLAKAQDEATLPTPVYENTFDSEDEQNACSIVGGGTWITDTDRGGLFQNAMDLTGRRANYLVLPATSLSVLKGKTEMTVCFWACLRSDCDWSPIEGAGGYFYSPIFSAYAAAPDQTTGNGMPMFVAEARGTLQINNNLGNWSDFTDAENDKGGNKTDVSWLGNKAWHLVSMSIVTVETNSYTANFCVDGVAVNSWTISTSDPSGFFVTDSDYSYVCLGGNQAWAWDDPDAPFVFDNFRVFDVALTADQLKELYTTEGGDPDVAYNAISNITTDAEVVSVEYFNLSGAKVSEPTKGITLEKTTYSDGTTSVNKILK